MIYRRGTHRTQFDGSVYAGSNCTPTSGANGAREATDGAYDHSGAYVRSLVAQREETSPSTPGWSLDDLDLAMSRAKVPFSIGTGDWAGLVAARAKGCGIVLQGDSDQFANSTCSGSFNGDHAIYVHPETNAEGLWLIGDPICRDWRWERSSVLRNYAEKFSPVVKFGIFTTPIRSQEAPMNRFPISADPKVAAVKTGAQLYRLDLTPDIKVSNVSAAYSPGGYRTGGVNYRVVDVSTGGIHYLWLVKASDCTLTNPNPIDTTPYSQTDLDAKYKSGIAEGTAAVIAKIKSALGL